jgi:hypothetical protein
MGSTNQKLVIPFVLALAASVTCAQPALMHVAGTVLGPNGHPLPAARLRFESATHRALTLETGQPHATPTGATVTGATATDNNGNFALDLPAWAAATVQVDADGFAPITQNLTLGSSAVNLTLHMEKISATTEEVLVTADVSEIALDRPDPSEKVLVREELLDANPGRPGAPISIPGMPIETAAGGIKAPQYFVPGVAGDHGEPIAQYIAVGGYLVPNNLSANAHGNGYADPNIYVSGALANVATDGGAFNVLEGDHALNLAATYSLRPRVQPALTLTGDYRDLDLAASFAPSDAAKKEWLAIEGNYGNGLMRTLEHRKQFKWNAQRIFDPGRHELTLLSVGYWGMSHEGNLVPIGFGIQVNDTIDPRQQDQTHTSILAADDRWKLGTRDEAAFSGFFRTYNLALFSNFGEGLIRQSEFRTVEGAEARETHEFKPWLKAMAGVLYNEDDLRNDDLDHYLSANPTSYGPFVPVLGNNITIREAAPYIALDGDLGRHLRFYAGLRSEAVEMRNQDKFKPQYSFDAWHSFEEPKATLTWSPGTGRAHWLPSASFSVGQAFFTEDPRITIAPSATAGASALANPFERSHSEQLVVEKAAARTDLRITLGETRTTATTGKIDPDNGTAFDLGPGTMKFLTVNLRRQLSFGSVSAVFSKADARLASFNGTSGMVTPEAPRTIFDALATLDKLPAGLHARGEYEYVGHKLLDVGNAEHPAQYEAIPVGETRLAVVRPFMNGRLEVGVNGMVARGYTGQTTEAFNPGWTLGTVPYCSAGSGPSGLANDFDCGTVERSVGVRMVSWAGGSLSWRFGGAR